MILSKHVKPGTYVSIRAKDLSLPVIGEVVDVDDSGVVLIAKRGGGTTFVSWSIVESLDLDVDPRLNEYGVVED